MRLAPAVVLVLAALDLLAATRAEACSPPPCWAGSFAPRAGATIPANAPGLLWRPMSTSDGQQLADPRRVTLTKEPDLTPLAFTPVTLEDGTVLIVPAEPLVDGARYTLSDGNECGFTGTFGPRVTFDVGPAAPLPTRLGALRADEPVRGPVAIETAAGTCTAQLEAVRVDVGIVADHGATPWLALLQFSTTVDGRAWRPRADLNQVVPLGESWVGFASDRVFTGCPATPDNGIGVGAHVVTFEARLPGSDEVLVSEPLDIVLACDADGGDEDDDGGEGGGCTAGGLGASPWLGLAVLALRRRRRA